MVRIRVDPSNPNEMMKEFTNIEKKVSGKDVSQKVSAGGSNS